MGFSHSPKTVTEDLVFIYDTGNGKSFRGEPTENLLTGNMNTSGPASLGSDAGGTYVQFGNNTSGYAAIVVPNISIPSGATYTWSFELKPAETFTTNFSWDTNEYSQQYPSSNDLSRLSYNASTPTMVANEWTQYRLTVTMKTGLTGAYSYDFFRFFFPTFQNKKIYYRNVQFELKDHITPYVGLGGIRSATESLKDIRTQDFLDVTNTSYDSSGTLSFDGSSDHITGVLPISGGGEPHTIEMVLSPDINQSSFGSRRDPFSIGNATTHQYSALDISPGFMNWYFYSKDTTFTNNPTLVAGQYYHFIFSYAGGFSNNTNKRVWINGIEQTLSAGANEVPLLPDNPQFSVGRDRGRNTAYFPGEIPVFKVYKKGLTEKEALANFNAIRGRFNI